MVFACPRHSVSPPARPATQQHGLPKIFVRFTKPATSTCLGVRGLDARLVKKQLRYQPGHHSAHKKSRLITQKHDRTFSALKSVTKSTRIAKIKKCDKNCIFSIPTGAPNH